MTPRVCVLTLNWNGKAWLRDCVESILHSRYPAFKAVVIDNGSTDGSATEIKRDFPEVTVLENGRNLGYSEGFNVGLRYGFGPECADYCLVMNNDTVLDPEAIAALVEAAEANPNSGFVTGKVYYHDQPDILQTVGKREDPVRWNGEHIGRFEKDSGQYNKTAERCFVDDIFTLVRRKMFEQTGGYDPTFFLQCEEYDWQARAKALGWTILYTPDARLWHKESMTLGKKSPKKAYYDARNPLIVILIHRPPSFFRRYFRRHLVATLAAAAASAARLRMGASLRSIQGLASGIWWGLKNRKLTLRHLV